MQKCLPLERSLISQLAKPFLIRKISLTVQATIKILRLKLLYLCCYDFLIIMQLNFNWQHKQAGEAQVNNIRNYNKNNKRRRKDRQKKKKEKILILQHDSGQSQKQVFFLYYFISHREEKDFLLLTWNNSAILLFLFIPIK